MSDYVTYKVEGVMPEVKIILPIATISHTPVIGRDHRRHRTVRSVYTIRGFINIPHSASTHIDKWLDDVRRVLTRGQGTFTWHKAGKDIKLGVGAGAIPAVDDGPHPTNVLISEIQGRLLASVTWQFGIETDINATLNITQSGNEDSAVLDFMYTMQTNMDLTFTQTRTITGVLRLSSSHILTSKRSADAFRSTIDRYACGVPNPVDEIWQRIAREYRISDDQRAIMFTFTDIQKYAALPIGMVAGDISISSNYRDGIGYEYEYELEGWYQGGVNVTRRTVRNAAAGTLIDFVSILQVQQKNKSAQPPELNAAQVYFKANDIIIATSRLASHNNSNRTDFSMIIKVDVDRHDSLSDTDAAKSNNQVEIAYGVVWAQMSIDWAYHRLVRGTRWKNEFKQGRNALRSLDNKFPAYGYENSKQARTSWDSPGVNNTAPSSVVGYCGQEDIQAILTFAREEKNVKTVGGVRDTSKDSSSGSESDTPSTETASSDVPHVYWQQSFRYTVDHGKIFVPVLGAGAPVQQTLHSPYTVLTITGEARRRHKPPEEAVPPYKLTPENGGTATLLHHELVPSSVSRNGIYSLTWRYILQLNSVDADSAPNAYKKYRYPWTTYHTPADGWQYEADLGGPVEESRGYEEVELDTILQGKAT